MFLRVRHPAEPPHDVQLGPASGRLHDFREMRKPIDEALKVKGPRARIGHSHESSVAVEVAYR